MKKIFISYSHKDEHWKDRLVRHLKGLGLFDIWDDRKIKVGEEWKPAIENALNQAHIAILMVSADFLSSNFICTEEVPRLIERKKNQGVWVIPLFVSPCPWKKVKWLAAIQGVPRDNKTLQDYEDQKEVGKVERVLSALAEEIAEKIQDASIPPPHSWQNPFTQVLAIRDGQRFIDRESDLRLIRERLIGGSVSLQGDNKIGKSSLLWKLEKTWPGPAPWRGNL